MFKQQDNYPLSPPKLFTTKLCTLNLKYQFYGGISFEYILHYYITIFHITSDFINIK